jgi:serine/threonine protein kinase
VTPEPPQLPGFRQLAPLRRGRHADVFRGRQQHPDRWVAVTVFDVRLTERGAAEQFRTEARAIAKLAHPGIIAVHTADVLPDARPYLVTELCEGSLADRIAARGRLDSHEVTATGLVVGRALLHAHDAGVWHGDLTPACVLLRDGAVPVLADVEPAVLRDYRDAAEPTPTHAAPETVRADGAVDDRTDVYGLGAILYTALAGRAPVPARHGEQERDRLARILLDEPPAPPGPSWLAELVTAMLAKDPAARPTLHHVVDLLAADGTDGLGAPPSVSASSPGAAGENTAGRGPSPWALTAACLAVVVAVVAGVLLAWPAVG